MGSPSDGGLCMNTNQRDDSYVQVLACRESEIVRR